MMKNGLKKLVSKPGPREEPVKTLGWGMGDEGRRSWRWWQGVEVHSRLLLKNGFKQEMMGPDLHIENLL